MRRCIIQVVIQFFDILTVIALRTGQSKHSFLQNRILPIPHSQGKTDSTFLIGDSCDPVLPPSVHPASSVIVGKIIPGTTIGTVILPNGSPLPFTEVRPPF